MTSAYSPEAGAVAPRLEPEERGYHRETEAMRAVLRRSLVADPTRFTRAAAELHLSQPALSRRVAGLEGALGASLVARGPTVTVTEAGRRVLAFAQALGRVSVLFGRRTGQRNGDCNSDGAGWGWAGGGFSLVGSDTPEAVE